MPCNLLGSYLTLLASPLKHPMVIRKIPSALQLLDREYTCVSFYKLQKVEDSPLTFLIKQLIGPEDNGREY
jgi:hypothetical protein